MFEKLCSWFVVTYLTKELSCQPSGLGEFHDFLRGDTVSNLRYQPLQILFCLFCLWGRGVLFNGEFIYSLSGILVLYYILNIFWTLQRCETKILGRILYFLISISSLGTKNEIQEREWQQCYEGMYLPVQEFPHIPPQPVSVPSSPSHCRSETEGSEMVYQKGIRN